MPGAAQLMPGKVPSALEAIWTSGMLNRLFQSRAISRSISSLGLAGLLLLHLLVQRDQRRVHLRAEQVAQVLHRHPRSSPRRTGPRRQTPAAVSAARSTRWARCRTPGAAAIATFHWFTSLSIGPSSSSRKPTNRSRPGHCRAHAGATPCSSRGKQKMHFCVLPLHVVEVHLVVRAGLVAQPEALALVLVHQHDAVLLALVDRPHRAGLQTRRLGAVVAQPRQVEVVVVRVGRPKNVSSSQFGPYVHRLGALQALLGALEIHRLMVQRRSLAVVLLRRQSAVLQRAVLPAAAAPSSQSRG